MGLRRLPGSLCRRCSTCHRRRLVQHSDSAALDVRGRPRGPGAVPPLSLSPLPGASSSATPAPSESRSIALALAVALALGPRRPCPRLITSLLGPIFLPSPSPVPSPSATPRPPGPPDPGEPGFVAGTKAKPRIINIAVTDLLLFDPTVVSVQQGETITFRITNTGKAEHEFKVGPMKDVFDDLPSTPEVAGITPGTTKTLTYTFSGTGPYAYACHAPGHFENGMFGFVNVVPTTPWIGTPTHPRMIVIRMDDHLEFVPSEVSVTPGRDDPLRAPECRLVADPRVPGRAGRPGRAGPGRRPDRRRGRQDRATPRRLPDVHVRWRRVRTRLRATSPATTRPA